MEDKSIDKSVGNENRYTMWCDALSQRRHYGVCLWLKDSYDNGRISPNDPHCDCAIAMSNGTCVAVKMREEEIDAGMSIYFKPKIEIKTVESVDKNSDGFKRGWNHVGNVIGRNGKNVKIERSESTKRHTNRKTIETPISDVSMADVITRAAVDELNQRKISMSELIKMKKRVIELSKTDKAMARKILDKVKTIERTYEITK